MIRQTARALRVTADALEARGATRLVRKAPIDDLAAAYDYIAAFRYGHIDPSPYQVRSEILELLERLAAIQPRTVLELGTARGGTLFLFTRVAADDASLVTVDLEHGQFGGGYPAAFSPFLRSFARARQTIHLVRGDTKAPATFQAVKNALRGRLVDFLFIDADHTLEGVSGDYERYSALVGERGLIAFHDIVPGDPIGVGQVPEFWSQVKDSLDHEEIVENWTQGGYGYGLVRKARKESAGGVKGR